MTSRYCRLLAVLPTLALLAGPSAAADAVAHDDHMSASQLYNLCSHHAGGGGNPLEAGECIGYIVGVADTFDCKEGDHGLHWNADKAGGSQIKLVVTVLQYLDAHPEARSQEAHKVVGRALQTAYSCD